MKCLRLLIIILVSLTLFFVTIPVSDPLMAATTTNINSTIQIGVCGNDVAEGNEECDGADLKAKSCASVGQGSGTLGCTISCNIETTGCTAVMPTSSSTPIVSPSLQPTATPIAQQQSSTVPSAVQVTSAIAEPSPVPFIPGIFVPTNASFPQLLRYFGANDQGFISQDDLRSSVSMWVTEWQSFMTNLTVNHGNVSRKTADEKCDINHDSNCDLVDLSVMLYYVN